MNLDPWMSIKYQSLCPFSGFFLRIEPVFYNTTNENG